MAVVGQLLQACPAAAQLPTAGPGSVALGAHDVATVRNFEAVAANPAGLGLATGDFTATFVSVRLRAGLEPVGLREVGDWQGTSVPAPVRHGWLDRIVAADGARGAASLGVTPVAASYRGFGVQLSTVAAGRLDLNPDASELLLFGNVGRTGEPRTFQLDRSRLDGWVVSTLALAHGQPLGEVRGGRAAIGATASLVVGHELIVARDVGTTLGGEPLEGDVRLPVISTSSRVGGPGHGVALGVGAAWESEALSLGLAVRNVVNTFRWDLRGLVYRRGTAIFDQEESDSDFDERPATGAPAEVRGAVEGMRFGPIVEVGMGHGVRPGLRMVASAGARFGDDLVGSSPAWLGAGIESRRWATLPVRGHLTFRKGGVDVGAGATLELGPVHVGTAGSVGTGGVRGGSAFALAVSWREDR